MDGKSTRAVVRLIGYAAALWPHLDGERPDVDLLTLRLDRFLNYIYHWCASRLSQEDREKFEWELEQPLEGEVAREVRATPAVVAEENDALAAIMGMQSRIESR